MRKKLLAVVILITMILPMFLNFYKVEAYSGELDPNNDIYVPSIIWIKDGIATGTIKLYSGVEGYSISYQKVDITQEKYNAINNKIKEVNDYIEECNEDLKIKKAAVDTLKKEWENLKSSETATQEQITQALNNYNSAVEEYNGIANTYKTNSETKKSEYIDLIPNYTSSWIETTNTEDNVQLDLKNYSGTIYFILWVKVTNGTDTYYDMAIYSQNIQKDEKISINKSTATIKVDETLQLTATSSTDAEITWTSSDETVATVNEEGLVTGLKEGTAVITAKGSDKTATCTVTVEPKTTTGTEDNEDGDWTDFSKTKLELERTDLAGANLKISDVTIKEGSHYYLFITSNSNKPNVTSDDTTKIYLSYNKDSKKFNAVDLSKYVELNQELYATILEVKSDNSEKIVLSGKKLERYAEPKYSDAFFATFMTNERDQILTSFTHSDENNRNIQIKIGKITDLSILSKIKNQDASGFASLLTFAKSNDGMYNKTIAARKNYYRIGYEAGEGYEGDNTVNGLDGLKDGEYYFLYIKPDDENGKYITQEAVTLAQASVYEDGDWYLLFYGNEDFEWVDFGDVEEDDTKAPVKLPDTGIGKYIVIVSILAIVVIASYIQVRKLKEIK